MRRSPALLIFLGALFSIIGSNQAHGANETKVTSVVVSGLNTTISWSTSDKQRNTAYQVEVTDKSKTKKNISTFKTPSSKIVIKELKAWNQYSIRVRAVVGNRLYSWSKPVLFLTTQNKIPDLAVSSVSYRTATINWGAVSGATGYKIYLDGIALSVASSTSFELKNLLIGKNYAVSVAAIKGAIEGMKSDSVIFTTLNIGPQNLVNTSTTNTTAKFEWSAISGVDEYEMYLDDKLVERVKTNSYEFKNLTPGQAIVIKVIGRFGDQRSDATSTKAVLKKESPSSLKLIDATANSLNFEWVGSSNFSKYNVYVDGLRASTTTTTTYTVSNLKTGQSISIYVTGVEGTSESSASETLKANTLVTTPAAPTVTVINAVSARVSWPQDLAAKNFLVSVFDGVKATAIVTNTAAGTATSTIVTGLAPGTSYTASIIIDYGTITTLTSPVTAFTTTRPAPTGLAISGITSTGATITWEAVPGALRYEYSRDGLPAVNAANALSASISSLSAGVTYAIRIRAVFVADTTPTTNVSEYSAAVSFTTLTDPAFKPTSSAVPSITISSTNPAAAAIVGATFNASTGTWTGTPAPSSYSYQWQRSYDGGDTWANLQGATSSSYVLVVSDYGFRVRVGVTATNTNGSTVAYSEKSAVIGSIVNLQIPIVRGTLVVGEILSATQGSWHSADPLNYSYAWLRDGSAITNATLATYTLVNADIGSAISVRVTARSSLASLSATSASRSSVPVILSTAVPTITGTARTAETLTSTTGTWLNDTDATYSYQWEQSSDGALWDAISGATSSTYVLASGQVGKVVRVQVRASKVVSGTTYSEVVYSASTATVVGTVTGLVIANTSAPVVSGSWTVGSVLTTTTGSWSSTGTFAYKWQSSSDESTWSDISSATASTYTMVSADAGKFIRAVVTITSASGAGTAYSASTRKVGAPYNTVAAAVTGTVRVGSTQTTTNGTWSNSPTSYSYQWQSSSNGIAWSNIGSATNSTYVPTFAQANLQIRVIVTATNAVDTATVTSNVVSGFLPPEATVIPTISGTATVGQTLTATSGTWPGSPSAGSFLHQWQRSTDGVTWTNISAATATTYVLVTGDAGYVMRVQVSLSTNAGTSVAYSLATAAVASP